MTVAANEYLLIGTGECFRNADGPAFRTSSPTVS